ASARLRSTCASPPRAGSTRTSRRGWAPGTTRPAAWWRGRRGSSSAVCAAARPAPTWSWPRRSASPRSRTTSWSRYVPAKARDTDGGPSELAGPGRQQRVTDRRDGLVDLGGRGQLLELRTQCHVDLGAGAFDVELHVRLVDQEVRADQPGR